MANWSTTDVTIKSDNIFTIAELHNKFQKEWGHEFFNVEYIEAKPNELLVSGQGRWDAKLTDLADELCSEFEDIQFAKLTDSEPGNNFFDIIEIVNNEISIQGTYDYVSQEAIDHYGVGYFYEDYYYYLSEQLAEDPDFSDNILTLLLKNGYTVEDFK